MKNNKCLLGWCFFIPPYIFSLMHIRMSLKRNEREIKNER
nr:hypothetical protein BSM_10140 [uncultured archaeon]